jgi:DNA-binding CsgD family transcriptional regulator
MALLDLSERNPLVVAVDDVHYTDVPSLQCLAYLIRRLRSARALVVLNETVRPQPGHPPFMAELLRQPHYRRIRLETLSEQGVEALLAQHLPVPTAQRLAAECHSVSGGNAMLVNGLIADYQAAARSTPEHLVVGPSFAQALVVCMHRSEVSMLKVARGLAVLDEPSASSLLGQLLDLDAESTSRAVNALSGAGLLDAGRFRHRAAREVVLDGMVPEERAAMHARAARLLDSTSAPATVVARHLLAAESVNDAWAPPVLHEAAEQALADADVDLAIACLRRAQQAGTNEAQRADSRAALARAAWRINPSIAARHISDLRRAALAGHLTGPHTLTLIKWLLWFGRVDDALQALNHFSQSINTPDAETIEGLSTVRLWLACMYPSVGRLTSECQPSAHTDNGTPAVSSKLQAARLLARVMKDGPSDASVAKAEQILHGNRLDERTLGPIGIALTALIYSDRLTIASLWCDPLMREAEALRAPTWNALFTLLRAEIAMRQGDLFAAQGHARAGLTLISPKSWGVAVGAPVAVLLQACIAMGRFQDAADHLQVPVPDALFQTPIGLQYLRARGQYFYAIGRVSAALTDFESCGELMAQWGLEFPAFVPWWSDAAQTCLRLGQDRRARELVTDQLSRLGAGHVRTRGLTLRVLAATSELKKRPALLRLAVEALQASGDRLELAYALADLGQAHHARGEFRQARTMLRRANQLAKQCGARSLSDTLLPDTADSGPGWDAQNSSDDGRITQLSDAERRVAALAARGHTNRQIADQLYVTVSTVEQHLTRVYRKLDVNRRADLPLGLHPEIADSA